MKKRKNLLILVAVLIVLLGGLYYVSSHPTKTSSTTTSSDIKLIAVDGSKIQKIELVQKSGTLTLVSNGKTWDVTPSVSYKLDATKIAAIAKIAGAINATKIVDNAPTDLDPFGLKTPVVTAKIYLKDNTTKEVYLGNKTPIGDDYYFMIKGDSKVYSVASEVATDLSYTLSSVRDSKLVTLDTTKINDIKYSVNGAPAIEIKANANQTDQDKTYSLNGYLVTAPYKSECGADETKVQALISALPDFTVSQFLGVADKDLSKYGLDKPSLDATVSDGTTKVHFKVGKNLDSSNVYFMIDGSNEVYTMDPQKLSGFSSTAFDLVAKDITLQNIDDVDKIVFDGRGTHSEAVLTRTTQKATKTGESDTTTTTYKIDGNEIKEASFKAFYTTVIGFSADAENDKTVAQNPEYTLTYYLNKGAVKQITYTFCPYDGNFDAVFVNGKSDFLVSKDQVTKLVTALTAAKAVK
jgi:hypothetical protein